MAESTNTSSEGPESGLIVQQEGKPQKILAKFLNLLLNYQFGLSISVVPELGRATSVIMAAGQDVRCVFVIQNIPLKNATGLSALSRRGKVPLFLVLPQKLVTAQGRMADGLENVYFCAWELAFAQGAHSLQRIVAQGLEKQGFGNLFKDLEETPYNILQQRVERRLKKLNTLPTLPEIVMRIMRLVNDPETTTAELEQVLCRDPAIVMKLMQVVRSPIFMGISRQGRWSLNDIIVRLGHKKVGAIAQQIKMINSLVRPEQSHFDLHRFWEHSVGCALIADRLYEGKKLRFSKAIEFNDYWIGALLHDIGKLVLGFFFWDWFARVIEHMPESEYDFRKSEARLGNVANHERVGQLLLINGNMGENLAAAVGSHHAPGEQPAPLVSLIHMADNLCKDLGLGYLPDEKGSYDEHVLRSLGLSEKDPEHLRAELAGNLVDEIKGLVEQCL